MHQASRSAAGRLFNRIAYYESVAHPDHWLINQTSSCLTGGRPVDQRARLRICAEHIHCMFRTDACYARTKHVAGCSTRRPVEQPAIRLINRTAVAHPCEHIYVHVFTHEYHIHVCVLVPKIIIAVPMQHCSYYVHVHLLYPLYGITLLHIPGLPHVHFSVVQFSMYIHTINA